MCAAPVVCANRPLVLVIDDDPVQCALVREALEHVGFKCDEANGGIQGLEKIESLQPDLVILDVMMPDLDGFTVCSRLRLDPQTVHLPVLMTTGLDDIASIERAFEVGASDFLTKPITLSVLGYHVKYMLKASRMEQDLRSAKKQAEKSKQEAEKAKQRAETANLAKTNFLTNMSHELRTPLNAIMGFSELMWTEKLGPIGSVTYRNYAHDILDSATHLLQVINDILDLTKVESDNFELHKEVFALGETVTDVVRTVGGQAKKAEVSLHACVGSDVPMLYSDERRLKQILLNLVSNSIKFTPQGGKVTTNAAISTTRELAITVADTGIGIPEAKIEVALSPFGQVDDGLDRRYEGTGLGLALAKSMTEQLGGKLSLKSKVGEGTVVTLTFPREYIFANEISHGEDSKDLVNRA